MTSFLSGNQTEKSGLAQNTAYIRKTCPILPYTKVLLKLLKLEKDIIQKILPKKLGLPIQTFQATTVASIDTLIDILELMLGRVRKVIQSKKEGVFMSGMVSDCAFVLMDVLECFGVLFKEYDGVITVFSIHL